jgi:hypothetical protein
VPEILSGPLSAGATALWSHIATNYLSKTTLWGNKLSYGSIVNPSVIDEMVTGRFGGYNKIVNFTIGTTLYKLKALPIQNKVVSHGGAASAGASDRMMNIICGLEGQAFGSPPLFNFHVDTRTPAREAELAAAAARRAAAANGDWVTV